ncbi:hypothetical protein KXS11_17625 [Plantibacter flavus]
MSETSKEAGAILFAALKWPLMIGGLVLALVGVIGGATKGIETGVSFTLAIGGIAALILGIAIQSLDRAALARRYNRWATEAAEGYGPVLPASAHKELVRQIILTQGLGGDTEGTFRAFCQDWAVKAARSRNSR